MAIYRLLQKAAFDSEEIKRMSGAYELALVQLQLKPGTDPLNENLAKLIIEVARMGGEKDAKMICARVLSLMHGEREAC